MLYLLLSLLLIYLLYTLYLKLKPISFKGKTVWVTGSSAGIGEGLAKEFHRLGAFVILSGRNKTELSRVHSYLPNSKIFELDLGDSSSVFKRSKELLSSHQVDILINNAGVSQRCMFDEVLDSLKVERSLMEVNFFSVVALTKCFVKSLNGRKGTVVVVSSTAGLLPSIGSTGYSATKSGIIGYFQSIAAELKEVGVSVVNLVPGYVDTNGTANALNFKGEKSYILDPRNKNGLSVKSFAEKAAREIYFGRSEIIITQKLQYLGYYLKSVFPESSTRLVRLVMLKEVRGILKKGE